MIDYIYIIFNNINGKAYVGQTRHPKKRWREHKNDCHNQYLKRSIEKYGSDNFTFNIIGVYTRDQIDLAEEYWIRYYDSANHKMGYNLELGGKANKVVSETTRKKMSIAQTGKTLSPETRRKISEIQIGKILSPETKQRMSISRTGKKNHMFGKTGSNSPSSKRIGILNPMFGRKSEENPSAKLTFKIAEEIRNDSRTYKISSRKLASKYGVGKTTILDILNNRSYTR